jgi:hypothetical protein
MMVKPSWSSSSEIPTLYSLFHAELEIEGEADLSAANLSFISPQIKIIIAPLIKNETSSKVRVSGSETSGPPNIVAITLSKITAKYKPLLHGLLYQSPMIDTIQAIIHAPPADNAATDVIGLTYLCSSAGKTPSNRGPVTVARQVKKISPTRRTRTILICPSEFRRLLRKTKNNIMKNTPAMHSALIQGAPRMKAIMELTDLSP